MDKQSKDDAIKDGSSSSKGERLTDDEEFCNDDTMLGENVDGVEDVNVAAASTQISGAQEHVENELVQQEATQNVDSQQGSVVVEPGIISKGIKIKQAARKKEWSTCHG